MANQRYSRKILNICIVCIIIIVIIFIAMMLVLDYDENGETNMPFSISKISVISTADGANVENSSHKWDINVTQNNDIYLYIEKNANYKKQETIESVLIDEFNIAEKPEIGEIKIYKPSTGNLELFENIDENIITKLQYKGTKSTNTKNLQISNQGGVLSFRCANNNIGEYISDSDEEREINNYQLINKINLSEEKIKAKISFNVTITLNSGKVFKAENIAIQIPNENIANEGKVGKEYTDLQDIVFKRIEN